MDDQQDSRQVSKFRLIMEMILVYLMATVFAVVVSGLLYWVLGGTQGEGISTSDELQETREIATFFAAPIFIFLTLVFGDILLRQRQVSLRQLGFKRPESLGLTIVQGLLLTALLLAFWVGVWKFYAAMGYGVPFEIIDVYSSDEFRFFYAMTAMAWIASSFGEEVLFRGFFMNNLYGVFGRGKMAMIFAVLFQAVLFSIMHTADTFTDLGQGLIHAIPVLITGVILGAAYFLLNRNLWPLIIAHGILNNIYFLLVYSNVIG